MTERPIPGEPARRPPDLFGPAANTIFRLSLLAGALLVTGAGSVVFAFYHSPWWTREGDAPTQPVQFSHRHHAGELRIDCRFCHQTVETSASAGLPSTQTCLTCHSQIFTDTAMLQPLLRSAEANEPLQWTRVNALPGHVYFNHSIHVAKGVACTTCHGEVGDMALEAKGHRLDMRWCLDCHRDPSSRLSPPADLFHAVVRGHPGSPLPPPAADPPLGQALIRLYGIHPEHLTDCSTCHR